MPIADLRGLWIPCCAAAPLLLGACGDDTTSMTGDDSSSGDTGILPPTTTTGEDSTSTTTDMVDTTAGSSTGEPGVYCETALCGPQGTCCAAGEECIEEQCHAPCDTDIRCGADRRRVNRPRPEHPPPCDHGNLERPPFQISGKVFQQQINRSPLPHYARQILARYRRGRGKQHRLDPAHPFPPAQLRWQVEQLAIKLSFWSILRLPFRSHVRTAKPVRTFAVHAHRYTP